MKKYDPEWIAQLVHDILKTIYVRQRRRFQREARQRDMTVEQLAAAAVTTMIGEQLGVEVTSPEAKSTRRPGQNGFSYPIQDHS